MLRRAKGKDPEKGTRTSVTIPPGDLESLQIIAEAKKVSVAWVIRDAIEKYIQADAEKGGYTSGEEN